MSQRALAISAGITQSKVTRIERGLSVPDVLEARRWLEAGGASSETAERVDALVRAAHAESVSYQDALADAPEGHLQDIAATREASATSLRAFQFAILPGLVQTSAYLRAILARVAVGQNVAAAVAARMQRQELLFDAKREFSFLLTPRTLIWTPDGEHATMAGQLDRLRQLDGLEHISIGVVPDDAPVVPAYSNFTYYDTHEGPVVAIELQHGGLTLTDRDETVVYAEAFDELRAVAVPIADYLDRATAPR
jgi:transcriptional regulator with XRE-family HTH domain